MASPIDSRAMSRAPSARRALGKEAGQSLLELALLTPLLLLLLIGVIEFGRFAYLGILVGNAARAGAVYGAQSLAQSADTSGIQTAADNDFQNNGQNVNTLTVNPSLACGCDSSGTPTAAACAGTNAGLCTTGHWVVTLSVQAEGTYASLFKFPGIPTSVTLNRTCAMRVSQQ
jgi:Flp pilus assembly protein TadG